MGRQLLIETLSSKDYAHNLTRTQGPCGGTCGPPRQDAHSIKDIMKAQGIPDFQAPPPIPKFIDTVEAIDELSSYDSFEPSPDDF
jgi:hypothetical protein